MALLAGLFVSQASLGATYHVDTSAAKDSGSGSHSPNDKVVLRRALVRHDGGWTSDGSNPQPAAIGLAHYSPAARSCAGPPAGAVCRLTSASWSQSSATVANESCRARKVVITCGSASTVCG